MKTLIKIAASSIAGLTLVGTVFQTQPSQAQTNTTTQNSARSIANRAHLLQGIEVETSELGFALGEDDFSAIDENIEEDYQLSMSESDVHIIEQDLGMWENSSYWENKGDVEDYAILVDIYDF
ncbi:hypothetical protein IQ238_14785 [Pleurocapsales cyanobacterium LEGE 06147]|nr:hypothetical protein [Pleurocapsales cyanobacterium LEGE 06147]